MSRELTHVQAAADILKQFGRAFIGYITAGLEPYSAQQKPDLLFVPDQGPNAGRVFFVELRFTDDGKLPQHYVRALREHRAFALEGEECECGGFAFASNANPHPDVIKHLAKDGIRYMGPITGPEMLASLVRAWATEANLESSLG